MAELNNSKDEQSQVSSLICATFTRALRKARKKMKTRKARKKMRARMTRKKVKVRQK